MASTIIPDPDLGKVLLEQKPTKGIIGNLIFLWLCGLMTLALGVPALVFMPVSSASISGGILCIAVGLGLCVFVGIMAWRYWMYVFLQEHGICEYRQGRARSLKYDHADEMTYSSLRVFMNGSYIHTVQKLALKSQEVLGPPLVCTSTSKEADGRSRSESRNELTDVRDRTSRIIEERLRRRLAREGTVDWTPNLRIRSGGLEVSDRKRGTTFVEWRQISKMELNEGMVELGVGNHVKPLLRTTSSGPNFFPAYSLAQRLWQRSRS